jgi:Protein of unknown function (DUF4038)/Putative collagen-binding domain of a collagenase
MKQKIRTFYFLIFVAGISLACSAQNHVYPLKISANKRYLVDQDNTPYPILGRTAWFIISLPVNQYHQFITNTVSKGYNAIEMHVLDHDPRGNNAPFNGNGDLPFLRRLDGAAWTGALIYADSSREAPDLTTPNEKYWSFADEFLAYCDSQKITVFIFPGYLGWSGGNQGWMKELIANGAEKTTAYGAFIANRYRNQKNLVWMLLGDMGSFTKPQKDAEAALIKGLKSVPGQQSNQYSAEANSGQNSTDQPDFGDQMTLNGVYDWDGKVSGLGRKAYAQRPAIPAFLLEEPYDEEGPDGNKVNPGAIQPVRRFQWLGWLSTIGGYISGNGYVWGFKSPDWQNHLDTKGAKEMGLLNSFIRSIPWWELVPSGMEGMKTLITKGGGVYTNPDYVAAAANPAGTLLVAYVPPTHQVSIEVDMTVMQGSIQANWYDPTNGNKVKIAGSPFSNKGKQHYTLPGINSDGGNDWVLVLKANED